MQLKFNKDMTLATEMTPILEIPLPVTLVQPKFGVLSETVLLSMAAAANTIGTLLFIQADSYTPAFERYAASLVPCLTAEDYTEYLDLVKVSRMVELAYAPGIENEFAKLREIKPGLFIAVGVPLDAQAAEIAVKLARTDVDTIHFYATDDGREMNSENPRYLKDMIREVHLKLVEARTRHKINLIISGGIAMAEHMAKSLICGADAVAIDIPLLIALECRLCNRCKQDKTCPVKIEAVELKWANQRIVNLLGAWYNQLLEVMGACGIREARRMRGEVGRSMWFEDLERDSFGPIFGTRKVKGVI
jgi:hypothetical protein